jgi:hypothetical protein
MTSKPTRPSQADLVGAETVAGPPIRFAPTGRVPPAINDLPLDIDSTHNKKGQQVSKTNGNHRDHRGGHCGDCDDLRRTVAQQALALVAAHLHEDEDTKAAVLDRSEPYELRNLASMLAAFCAGFVRMADGDPQHVLDELKNVTSYLGA